MFNDLPDNMISLAYQQIYASVNFVITSPYNGIFSHKPLIETTDDLLSIGTWVTYFSEI